MPDPIKNLQEIIDVCNLWIKHIKDGTVKGKDLLLLEQEGILEALSAYFE